MCINVCEHNWNMYITFIYIIVIRRYFVANSSPLLHRTGPAYNLVMKDNSVDLTGSDRDTDKEGSLSDLNDIGSRRPVAQSMRRWAIHSANSGIEQPKNSSPGQTPRRSDTFDNLSPFQTLSFCPGNCCCIHPIRPNVNRICRFSSIAIFFDVTDEWSWIRDAGTDSLIVIRGDPSAVYHWIVPSVEAPVSHHPWTKTTLGPLWQVSLFDTNTYHLVMYSRHLFLRFLFPLHYFIRLLFVDFFSSVQQTFSFVLYSDSIYP